MSLPLTKPRYRTAKTFLSTIGTIAGTAMLIQSISRDLLPRDLRDYVYLNVCNFINKFSTELTMIIYEYDGFTDNEIYTATQIYLADRISSDIHRLKVTKNPKEQHMKVAMEINEEYVDVYNGVKFTWSLVSKRPTREYYISDENGRSTRSDRRFLEVTFHLKYKDFVLNEYFPFIINYANTKKQAVKTLKLFTVERKNNPRYPTSWMSVNLDHPATFETVALDDGVKETVMKDLDRFLERREYYRKVGKAWKRGYLLYGPPGTGKSSLIAAMANYLKFDIYDLELTDIKSNSELRRLLVGTANRSILVVEDIDCSIELHDRGNRQRGGNDEESKVTLSGFLNFIDGLWSSCGDERIIIFTTNRMHKLDPALIRPGRMDVHINLSYCTPSIFRMLASNYLSITEHKHFEEIENLICDVAITPAEVAEQLLKDDDPDIALGSLIEFVDVKKKKIEELQRLKEEEAAKENENKQQKDEVNNEKEARSE